MAEGTTGRRSIRLRGFDYSQPGAYFVTICTQGRACVLSEIFEGEVYLSRLGEIVDACWRDIPNHFAHVALDVHVVMPDHIHGILRILRRGTACRAPTPTPPPCGAPTEAFGHPVKGSLPTVIRAFKSSVTRIARRDGFEGRFWQRGYYEKVIRNDDELARVRQYIHDNPDVWALRDDVH
jgi:REP element-mobilizing transposase RayT